MTDIDTLFEPFRLKSLTLPNRIVMAPMTRLMSPNGIVTDDVASYYRRRAENQVGLIVTEGTVIQRPVPTYDRQVPHFWGENALAAWKKVVDEVHDGGGVIAPQLWHAGASMHPFTDEVLPGLIDSPSGIFLPDDPAARRDEPMTEEAIADTVAAFAEAARASKALGFDAVELHGAHGYLIDQFFWHRTNLRSDRYGGDLSNRLRFGVEVVKAVRAAVGEDYPLILRISQWKSVDYNAKVAETPQEMETWLQPLADVGVDCFHCSQRRIWEPEFDGSALNFAGWAKKITGKATIAVGSVGLNSEYMENMVSGKTSTPASLDSVLNQLARGEFDLVAVGRALLNDPSWVLKVKERRLDELKDFSNESLNTLY